MRILYNPGIFPNNMRFYKLPVINYRSGSNISRISQKLINYGYINDVYMNANVVQEMNNNNEYYR